MAKKSPAPARPALAKLDALGVDAFCAAIVDNETITSIAKRLKVSFGTIVTWVEATPERSARVREARKQAAKAWDEQALAGIMGAKNGFQLHKAKEAAHHLRWRASKIAPREYGDKLGLGAAEDLPPLPAAEVNVSQTTHFEVAPADAYAAMLARKT